MELYNFIGGDTPEIVSDTFSTSPAGTCGFGYLVLSTEFQFIHEGKIVHNVKPFWVFNTHFALDEEVKRKSCIALLKIVKEVNPHQIRNLRFL